MTFELRNDKCDGYTMIEMIIVVLVVAILGAVMFTRADSVAKRGVPDQADLLRRDLRHIQSLALTYGIALRLNVTTTGYTVTCLATTAPCTTVGNTLIDPTTSQVFAVAFPSGLTMTGLNSSNSTVDFDSIGRPILSGTLVTTNPAMTFSLTGASKTSYVYLRPITGFAEVSY